MLVYGLAKHHQGGGCLERHDDFASIMLTNELIQ
jgi:hypothetical protein